MSSYRRYSLILTVILFLWGSTLSGLYAESSSKIEKNFLWQVTSKTTKVYLMGSIHLGSDDLYPLDGAIQEAYKESEVLALELNPLTIDQAELQNLVLSRGLYPGEETIADYVSEATLNRLKATLVQWNLDYTQLQKFKPWMLELILGLKDFERRGWDMEKGIDMYFIRQAENRFIVELETLEGQLGLLSERVGKNQEDDVLVAALDYLDRGEEHLAQMKTYWLSGDAEKMYDFLSQFLKQTEFSKKILDDRNVAMVKKIKDFLKSNKIHFVVVGAGHLGGKQGILNLLEQEGYIIQQVAKVQ